MAESTGLEPATSAVTGQRSNQLSYNSKTIPECLAAAGERDSNEFGEFRKWKSLFLRTFNAYSISILMSSKLIGVPAKGVPQMEHLP